MTVHYGIDEPICFVRGRKNKQCLTDDWTKVDCRQCARHAPVEYRDKIKQNWYKGGSHVYAEYIKKKREAERKKRKEARRLEDMKNKTVDMDKLRSYWSSK